MLGALVGRKDKIVAVDREGVIFSGRPGLDPDKARYASDTDKHSLAGIVDGADVFLGLSAGGILKPEMVATMADKPLILALANPYPEILPDAAQARRQAGHIAPATQSAATGKRVPVRVNPGGSRA